MNKIKLTQRTIYIEDGVSPLVEVDDVGWISVGYLGQDSLLLFEKEEFKRFCQFLLEINDDFL